MKVDKTWGGWNLIEIVWLVLFTSIAVGFTVSITGVLCVVLTVKGTLMSYVLGSTIRSVTRTWLISTVCL